MFQFQNQNFKVPLQMHVRMSLSMKDIVRYATLVHMRGILRLRKVSLPVFVNQSEQ